MKYTFKQRYVPFNFKEISESVIFTDVFTVRILKTSKIDIFSRKRQWAMPFLIRQERRKKNVFSLAVSGLKVFKAMIEF